MRRHLLLAAPACFLMLAIAGPLASSRAAETDLILQKDARRYGLERAWYAQIMLDPARSHLASMTPFVSSTKALVVYEIAYDGGKEVITERDVDAFGKMLGPEGAKKRAEERKGELEAAGRNPKLQPLVIPETSLYAISSHGLIQSIDAETGSTRWIAPIGRPDYPTSPLAVSEQYVALTNGSTLYVLNREDGKTLWQRRALGIPGAAPTLSPDLVYLPTIDGSLEAFRVKNHRETPVLFKFSGRGVVPATVSARSVAWVTSDGRMYVANVGGRGLRYRLETSDAIVSSPVFLSGNRLLVASIDGGLYCLHEMSGDVIWRYTTGEPISQAPVVIGDDIYLDTDEGSLVRIAAETGTEKWRVSRVRQFVSASEKRLYCVGETDELRILEAETGRQVGQLAVGMDRLFVTNPLTDRIFLATSSGLIQCLREMELRWPVVHAGPPEAPPAEAKAAEATKAPAKTPPAAAPPAAPAGAAPANPFGAPGAPANPFEVPSGANPFGSPPAGAPANPPANPPGAGAANPSGAADDPFK